MTGTCRMACAIRDSPVSDARPDRLQAAIRTKSGFNLLHDPRHRLVAQPAVQALLNRGLQRLKLRALFLIAYVFHDLRYSSLATARREEVARYLDLAAGAVFLVAVLRRMWMPPPALLRTSKPPDFVTRVLRLGQP